MNIILTEEQIKKMIKGLHNDWKKVDGKLIRIYDFPTYKDTISFVNKISEIAEKQNHHPEMVIGYDTVKVIMFDHEEGGISDKCHKFTDAVDDMVDKEESLDEASRSFAFTRKKRLFPRSAMMSNPDRFKEYDKEVKGVNEEKDPSAGTGKKPEGSGRRLYTDENPSDTVTVKFKTKEDIVDTLNKESFKSKPHKRQSQIINLIHQRVRAAYQNAKDPETKTRLKRGLDYIEIQKEKSKEKTVKMQDQNEQMELTEKCWPGYTQKGMKTLFGKEYPNCVKKKKK